MRQTSSEALAEVRVVAYDERWPALYAAERDRVVAHAGPDLLALEHIGSTAVPGLAAKPIVDMMAAVADVDRCELLLDHMEQLGYRVVPTGMPNRLLLRAAAPAPAAWFHLHLVEQHTWAERNERLLRDHLLAHPDAASAYGALKAELGARYRDDSLGYTRAKTDFIQSLVDQARAARGLPLVAVWED